MKFFLTLAMAVLLSQSCRAAEAVHMAGQLHLAEGKTFPEGTTVDVFREAAHSHVLTLVDATGKFVVEGLEAGETIRLTVPTDYEITAVSAPFHIAVERLEVDPLSSSVAGPVAPEITAEVIWKDRKVKWAEMRARIVRKMSGGFFKAEKLTPEQQETFISLRVASEDRVLKDLHEHRIAYLSSTTVMDALCAALQKSFGDDMARQYRQYQVDQLGWEDLQSMPGLEANNWLTAEEQGKLVKAWGPIFLELLDRAMDPEFQKATTTREAKLAYSDKISSAYLEAANGLLAPAQFARLQERFAEMRKQGIAEMDKEKNGK